jgi:Tfp pilus assembly protein PilX
MKTIGQYKQGGASLYVVIFTTLLLGIIAMGFVRIMLSESRQTTDYDLSQSAYDSALAGVEDAKLALLSYQECLAKGDFTSTTCKTIIDAMQKIGSTEDCDIVRTMLGRPVDADGANETVVQSEEGRGEGTTGQVMDQAYTCVLIVGNTEDYESDLSDNNRVRMVPIRPVTNSDSPNPVAYIRFSWFSSNDVSASNYHIDSLGSSNNRTGFGGGAGATTGVFPEYTTTKDSTPPSVEIQLIQSKQSFRLSELNASASDHTNRGTLILTPSLNGTTLINNSIDSGFAASSDKAANNPALTKCSSTAEFAGGYYCSVVIQLPAPINGSISDTSASSYLRVSLPYGNPTTDFRVEMLDAGGSTKRFNGVQSKIDSTGRANDLFRRVEARVEMTDVYYPYPEFTLTLNGSTDEALNKNFWVTKNSWFGANSGQL